MMANFTKEESKIIDMYLEEVAPKWMGFDPDTETFYLLPNAPDDIKRKRELYLQTLDKVYGRCIHFDF